MATAWDVLRSGSTATIPSASMVRSSGGLPRLMMGM